MGSRASPAPGKNIVLAMNAVGSRLTSAPISPPQPPVPISVPVHRWVVTPMPGTDQETGSRKLACSKEAEGCARCRREGIPCHYSLQKQMGRPRKRPREDPDASPALVESASANKTPMISVPPDLEDPGLAFLSFLSSGDNDFDASLPMDEPFSADSSQPEAVASWHVDYLNLGEVNFSPPADHMPSFSPAETDPALFTKTGSTDLELAPTNVPHLSPASSSSPGSVGSSMVSAESAVPNCSCTAILYMSIESLQRLSEDITEAIRQARLAAKTAYQVVNCPICSVPPSLTPAQLMKTQRALHSFQNLMLLATLIPSCVAAYERILQAVDRETDCAQADCRQIPFKLLGYGGTWGALGASERCNPNHLEYKVMEPAMWRRTIRALLRVDVYGIAGQGDTDYPDGAPEGPFHLGLKDIVLQMENRSKLRHAMMDGMTAAGFFEEPNCVLKMHKPGETPTCLRIISMARQSIDNLVIA